MQQADRGQAAASVPAGGIRPRPARRRRRKRGDGFLPYLYVAPALLVVGLVFAYPLVKIFDFGIASGGRSAIFSSSGLSVFGNRTTYFGRTIRRTKRFDGV